MDAQGSIDAAAERSALVRRAYEVASEAHAGQTRNASGGRPYIDHPVAVAAQLVEHGFSDEVLAAALLHDVVEDSELEVPDIREAGGSRVAELVAVLSDDESLDSYEERKREHRERVEAAGPDALDADAILAGVAATIGAPGDEVVIATTNVRHLSRFAGVDARVWAEIA